MKFIVSWNIPKTSVATAEARFLQTGVGAVEFLRRRHGRRVAKYLRFVAGDVDPAEVERQPHNCQKQQHGNGHRDEHKSALFRFHLSINNGRIARICRD